MSYLSSDDSFNRESNVSIHLRLAERAKINLLYIFPVPRFLSLGKQKLISSTRYRGFQPANSDYLFILSIYF